MLCSVWHDFYLEFESVVHQAALCIMSLNTWILLKVILQGITYWYHWEVKIQSNGLLLIYPRQSNNWSIVTKAKTSKVSFALVAFILKRNFQLQHLLLHWVHFWVNLVLTLRIMGLSYLLYPTKDNRCHICWNTCCYASPQC